MLSYCFESRYEGHLGRDALPDSDQNQVQRPHIPQEASIYIFTRCLNIFLRLGCFLCSEIPIFDVGRISLSPFPRARNRIMEIHITCQHVSESVLKLIQASFHSVWFFLLICFAELPACSTTSLKPVAQSSELNYGNKHYMTTSCLIGS